MNAVANLKNIFPGKSEMAQRMCAWDWTKNELGAPEAWAESLKTSVRILLGSRHPMFLWWGDNCINLYNDAYVSFLHSRHPAALGLPASVVWTEIW